MPEPRSRVLVTSAGTSKSTNVYIDGQRIPGVTALTYKVDVNSRKVSELTLTIRGVDLILEGSFAEAREDEADEPLDIDGILGDDYNPLVTERCPGCGYQAETTVLNAARSTRACPSCHTAMAVVHRRPAP